MRFDASGWLRAAVLALLGGWVAACDPPPPEVVLGGSAAVVPLVVVDSTFAHGAVDLTKPVEIRFSAPIEPESVGPRSVRVERTVSRRPVSATLRCAGDTLSIFIDPARGARGREDLRVIVEGAPSPRAVRSANGQALSVRFVVSAEVRTAVTDFDGPALVSSRPADGFTDVPTGDSVELRFSEALGVAGRDAADCITLRVNGTAAAASARLSPDGRRLLVRAGAAFPAGADISVQLAPWITDRAGNPLADGSRLPIRFRTAASFLAELREDFVCNDMLDAAGTVAPWGPADAPGVLVGRSGVSCAVDNVTPPRGDLGSREELRFQMLVYPEDRCGAMASALRVRFASEGTGGPVGPVVAAHIDAGTFRLDALDPSFEGNRRFATLQPVVGALGAKAWESDGRGGGICEISFESPLTFDSRDTLLLDVSLTLAPGARIAALPTTAIDSGRVSTQSVLSVLIDGSALDHVRPATALVTSGGSPCARSLWYDADCVSPRWQRAVVTRVDSVVGGSVIVEFQSAPVGSDGAVDESSASSWETTLDELPPWRFVRFRVRFDSLPPGESVVGLDSVTMPFIRMGEPK